MCGGKAPTTALDHPMVLPRCQGYLVPLSFILCDLTLYVQIQVRVPDCKKGTLPLMYISRARKNPTVLEDENPG